MTEADLANFVAVGFPAPVNPSPQVGDAALMASTLRVLEAPTARLVEAASLALVELSRRGALSVAQDFELSDIVARRLGYIADRLGAHLGDVGLSEFARLTNELVTSNEPLLLTEVATDSYAQQLKSRADEINRRWAVYGDLDLRFLPAA